MNNVVDKKVILERAGFVLEGLMDAVGVTYGYNGKTVLFADTMIGGTNLTQDGKMTLDHVRFQHELDTLMKRIVTEPAMKIATKSGDGTTSSILTIGEIFKAMYTHNPDGVIDKKVKDIIEMKIIPEHKAYIDKHKIDVSNTDSIVSVANIALGGDISLVKLISSAYKSLESTVFFTTGSYDNVTSHSGIKLPNMSATLKAANNEEGTYKELDAKVIRVSSPIQTKETISLIIKLLSQFANNNTKMVLIVDKLGDFATNILSNYLSMVNKDEILVNIIESSNILPEDKEYMLDLMAYLDLNPYMIPFEMEQNPKDLESKHDSIIKDMMTNYMSNADISLEKGECVFSRDNTNNKSIGYKTAYLQKILDEKDDNDIIDMNIKRRLSNLQGEVSHIVVGGATQTIRETRLALVEDGVLAVRSAISNGVVGGMHVATVKYLSQAIQLENHDSLTRTLLTIIKEGYMEVIRKHLLKEDNELFNSIHELVYSTDVTDITTAYDLEYNDISKNVLEPAETAIDVFDTTLSVIVALFRIEKALLSIPEEALRYNRPGVK